MSKMISNTNQEKGKSYENFINIHINKLPNTKKSYLWNFIPEQILFDAGLITDYNKHRLRRVKKIVDLDDPINTLKDVGIDILQVEKDDNITFIQCKNYAQRLGVDDLAGFWMMMSQHNNKKGIVYHSNNKLSVNIKEYMINDRIKFIHQPMENKDEIKDITNLVANLQIVDTTNLISNIPKLYDYQEEIVDLFKTHYLTNDKGILSAPSGTGKTIESCYISKIYDLVILLSPLKQYAEQNIDRYMEYDPSRKHLLVDSDGTRDINEIREFIKNNNKVLIYLDYLRNPTDIETFLETGRLPISSSGWSSPRSFAGCHRRWRVDLRTTPSIPRAF